MAKLNPKDFIITRKRKKYRFALFHNSPLCFEQEEWDKTWQPSVIEVGAGTGLFSVALAELYPDKRFTAIDIKGDRLQTGARLAEEKGLTNVRFLRTRADQLSDLFTPHSLESIWVTFPDPFPKSRSGARRLTYPTFLRIYKDLLTKRGALYLKTDARDLFTWSLEQLVAEKWQIDELSFDLHESELADDYKILTTFETRWTGEGIVTNLVKVLPPR
ncbi:MAG: putative tRNA ((7)-)-methyltransferase [Candidatus Saccharibacteria bacterium]|nr:putative tRNA ((7)-)-methyltransferase [Candidatus Saccharibacteria bacterium]